MLPLNTPVLTIGRLPENGLALPDDHRVSRNHAELRLGPQGPILTDLGSSNGTFIGDQQLLPNQPRVLVDGTSFRIGRYTLTYRASGSMARPMEAEDEPQSSAEPTAVVPVIAPAPVPVAPVPIAQAPQPAKPATRYPADAADSIYRHYLPDIF